MKISIRDAREIGYCARGLKAGAAKYGLDFKAFLGEGIEDEILLATGDAQLLTLVEHVHNREDKR